MVLRHVSILKDHPQGVCLCLAKVTELFKRFEELFKFKTLNLKSRWLNPVLWQYCCHSTGFSHRDFKFSVLNLKKTLQIF